MGISGLKNATALALLLVIGSAGSGFAEDVPIDVPAQDLSTALAQLSAETGISIIASQSVVAGRESPVVSGAMSPQAALAALLQDTALGFRDLGAGRYVVEPVASATVATQNADETPTDLGTLVLRGELIDRDIQDSQTSAVAVTQQDMEVRGHDVVGDVLRRTPGVILSDGRSSGIRGVNEQGSTGAGGGKTISVTVDGARVSDIQEFNKGNISTWDVQQVEVLGGPQSTQSGRNALAGAITVLSNDPEFFREARVRLGFGDYNTRYGALLLNTPLVEDRLAFRLSVDASETDGWIENEVNTSDNPGAKHFLNARASLRFEATDNLSAVLKYTRAESENGRFRINRADFPEDYVTNSPSETINYTEYNSWNLTTDYAFGDNSSLTYRGTYTDPNGRRFFEDAAGTVDVLSEEDIVEHELRYAFEGSNLKAVAGLFYTWIEASNNEIIDFDVSASFGQPPGELLVDSDVTTSSERENYAIFGEVEYAVTPNIDLIFGARYDVEKARRCTQGVETISGPFAALLGVAGTTTEFEKTSATYEAFLPKLGVVYNFSEDRSIALTYQRGYRAGGSGRNPGAQGGPADFKFDPEYTDTLEVAYRSLWDGGDSYFNANAFYTLWTDQQVVQRPNNVAFRIENAGESELWGAELAIGTTLRDAMSVFASVAYVETRFLDFVSNGEQLAGNEFSQAPNLTVNVGGEYAFDNGLSLGGDITYVGPSFSDVQNTSDRRNDAYYLTNLNAAYAFGQGWELVGAINNVTDARYSTFTEAASVRGGPPRTVSVFVTKDF